MQFSGTMYVSGAYDMALCTGYPEYIVVFLAIFIF